MLLDMVCSINRDVLKLMSLKVSFCPKFVWQTHIHSTPVCVHACMRVCVCVCVHACMHTCMCVHRHLFTVSFGHKACNIPEFLVKII